jgi:mannose-6-phosphate isomerase
MLPPLHFQPILKRIRWGGRRLGSLLGKQIGEEGDYAESWEIADHADGQSQVASGPLAGRTIAELIERYPLAMLGAAMERGRQFPLLIKFLDAHDWLSLQVHPDDKLARTFSSVENGKTEAWVILEAQPDSRICAGLQPGVTRDALRDALTTGQLEPLLNLIPVAAGDCIFVPAGTVHALGPGIVLAEIQQQSNLTFRLHDWGRLDANGQPRAIHVEESLTCTDFDRGPVMPVTPRLVAGMDHVTEDLVECEHFAIRRHVSAGRFELQTAGLFRVLMCLTGRATLVHNQTRLELRAGSTVLLPAIVDGCAITPVADADNQPVTILEAWVPSR